MSIAIAEIDRAHPLYGDARRIRFEVLRRPLGMPAGSEENPREDECRHWVAVLRTPPYELVTTAHEPTAGGREWAQPAHEGWSARRGTAAPSASHRSAWPNGPLGEADASPVTDFWGAVVSDASGVTRAVGTVLWLPETETMGRLLQMAVVPELQKSGVGRRLVAALEQGARDAGFGEVTLHARDIAVGFYERLGYAVYGEPFVEVGIDHRHMRKVLGA